MPATAACLLALTACGGGGGASHPGVASLPSTASSSATAGTTGGGGTPESGTPVSGAVVPPSSGSTAGRPQERLDDTPAEREALIHAWDQCLVDHGAKWTTTRPGIAGSPKTVADPIPKTAAAACENKLPLEPPELNPALNAHYRDDTLAEIKCLRKHGVMVHLVADTSVDPGGLSWTFDDGSPEIPANEGQLEDQCEQQAFGGGKGK
ncbi:hypothetical protein SAMN05216223_13072 [Actinacidiphila yanglinensis]|uniref:Uncharacterized protein n=1 Tax=Actinacidiphila yanglinensis TaxID=310779 RepID=A0A1H6EBZ7_9ACTN|nr:hypothetical protein [Actinacidiphila yanglinensis]SEG94569.1 hypothetical protein SAMN05216223_13072 [Actinacidiphila yanglinensis]